MEGILFIAFIIALLYALAHWNDCPSCNGSGQWTSTIEDSKGDKTTIKSGMSCPDCGGTGKKK